MVIKALGEGGNAKVYLGWDTNTSKQIAIKKMIKNNQSSWNMVNEEGKLMTKVTHKNVLIVIKYGADQYQDLTTGE